MRPLICEFFLIVNTTVLHDPWLVDGGTTFTECQLSYTWIFPLQEGSGIPNPFIVQGSTVFDDMIIYVENPTEYTK